MKRFPPLLFVPLLWCLLGADLVIPSGEVVTIQPGDYDTVTIRGTWRASRERPTAVRVETIVIEGGVLDLGTVDDPVDVDFAVVIKDAAPTGELPHLGAAATVGIVAIHGGTIYAHGTPRLRHVECGAALRAGQTVIDVPEGHGWRVGDRIWVPTLQQQDSWNPRRNPAYSRWDKEPDPENPRDVVAVPSSRREYLIAEAGCGSITLDRPLAEDVEAIPGVLGPLVVNLSRNIVFRSENPAGHRGHIAAAGATSGMDVRWVEIRDMGRTRGLIGEDGQAVPSVIGRYPLHMHHMHEGSSPRHVEGCVIDGGRATKWGLVVHQTHYATIRDNTVYNLHGGGIVCEDQNEFGCLFQGNLVGNITSEHSETPKGIPNGDPTNPLRGFEGAGYWATGFSQWRENIAVNCEHGFELPGVQMAPVHKTLFGGRGREVMTPLGMEEIPTATFEDCIAAACEDGVEFWRARESGTTDLIGCRIGNCRIAVDPTKESVFLRNCLLTAAPADDGTNGRGWAKNNGIIGLETNSAYTGKVELLNTRIEGMHCALFSARNFHFNGTVIRCQRGVDLGVRGNPELQWMTKTPPTAAPRFHNFPDVDCPLGNYLIEPSGEYPQAINETLPWMAYDAETRTWAFGGADD